MGDASFSLHARRVGDMLTGQEGTHTTPARWCERCGARLRQQNHGTLCAPCDATAEPYTPVTTGARCAWCGKPYTPWIRTQKYCSMACGEHVRQVRARMRRQRIRTTPPTDGSG